MYAAFYEKQGPARDVLRFGEQPTPVPVAGEVRVRLRASGVNPSDWKSRSGAFRPMAAPLIIPHSDGAGEIDAVGAGVDDRRIGERVWLWNGQWKRPFGTAAQFIAIPSSQAIALPETMSYAQGACLGIPAITAMQAVRLADVRKGETVLIPGGAGSVGHYAIQFAKAREARVIATVSSETKAAVAAEAGADAIINYRREDVGARVRALTSGAGVDAVIEVDLAANGRYLPHVLRPHGTVVIYGMSAVEVSLPALWLMQNSATLRLFLVYELQAQDRADSLAELDRLLQSGRVIHRVARNLPLDRIVEAHELLERGEAIGSVVLDIS